MTNEQKSQALRKALTDQNLDVNNLARRSKFTVGDIRNVINHPEQATDMELEYVCCQLGLNWHDFKEETELKPFTAIRTKHIKLVQAPNFEPVKGLEKLIPTNTKKALDARGQFCVTKGHEYKEAMSCHYEGLFQSELGCGTGCKGDSLLTAWLCNDCHQEFDQYKSSKGIMDYPAKVLHSFLFCIAIFKTLLEKKRQGKLKEC